MRSKSCRSIAVIIVFLSLLAGSCETSPAYAKKSRSSGNPCLKYVDRNYIICKESGPWTMPHGLPAGKRHYPGTNMTAAGPCGMTAANQKEYGGSGMGACRRYMRDRYGTWRNAYHYHLANNHW